MDTIPPSEGGGVGSIPTESTEYKIKRRTDLESARRSFFTLFFGMDRYAIEDFFDGF